MSNKRKIKQGFIQGILALVFSQVIIKILGLIYKLYLTNKQGFGDSGNAIYSAGFQIYALLLTLSSIGVPNAVAKIVSERFSIGDKRGAHRVFEIAFLTFASIGFLFSITLFLGSNYISNNLLQIPESEKSLVALSPSIFFVSIICVIRGYFNGMQNMSATANSQIIEQTVKSVFTIVFVELCSNICSHNTELMSASANLATTFATIGSFLYLYKYYKIRKRSIAFEIRQSKKIKEESSANIIKNILYVTIPMSLTSILISINKNVDSVTVIRGLKNFLSSEEAKIQYGILSGKVDTLTTMPLSFNMAIATALVPAVSSALARNNKKEATDKICFSLLITILIGIPSTVGMIIFAKPILNLLFPNASSGVVVLQIAAISIVFTMLNQIVNGALQGIGKIFIPAISLSIGVFIKVILNITLVPISSDNFILGGVKGAALATSVCHIISFIISFNILKNKINFKIRNKDFIIKPIIATVMMTICLYYTKFVLQNILIEKVATIIAIIIGVIIYILAVICLKIFKKDEILLLPYGEKIANLLKKIGIYQKL